MSVGVTRCEAEPCRADQEVEARLQEMDLLTADLERANSRVAEVERRNEKLRAEIEGVRSGSESAEKVRSLENQVADLQSEASRLLCSLDLQKDEAAKREEDSRKRLGEANAGQTKAQGEVDHLREKVRQFADYDEIKRELEIMKVTHPWRSMLKHADGDCSISNLLEAISTTMQMAQ